MIRPAKLVLIVATVAAMGGVLYLGRAPTRGRIPAGAREVVFWHFWGGKDRAVVEAAVERFNASQSAHYVRAVSMPGNNLDLKVFLALAGGDPPDLLNQDDPIVADWAHRGALVPIDELATPAEYQRLQKDLWPAARELATYEDRFFAVCNGLDVRALYYDKTLLDSLGLGPPRELADLDRIAYRVAPPEQVSALARFGYLPDPRRIWAWGIVFGGEFYNPATGAVTADSEQIVAALTWMASYARQYGEQNVSAFRSGDQALTGASFPLLQGRYAVIMDGQWRVNEIVSHQEAAAHSGEPPRQFGVVPLPPPPAGRQDAGWVNGNFFVVPRGSRNPEGAWQFIKFYSGLEEHAGEAARICAEGGWIPASRRVVEHRRFRQYLDERPLFREFVRLAASGNQRPTPAIPRAQFFQTEVIRAAENAIYLGRDPRTELERAAERIRARLEELHE